MYLKTNSSSNQANDFFSFPQVINESTGFLCEPKNDVFGRSMARFVTPDRSLSESMGEKGRKRVQQHFSFEAFTDKLNSIVQELADGQATDDRKNE